MEEEMQLGHWEYGNSFEVDDYFGFIYRVTDLHNNMEYIGRKQFHSHTRKRIKGRKNRKKVVKECKWREYTTSSNMINSLIEDHSMSRFKFEIIELCITRGNLSYREVQIQWEEKVLEATLPDGTRKYYNGNIGAIKFRKEGGNFGKQKPRIKTPKKKTTVKCTIDEVEYESITAASKSLNISTGVLNRRMASDKFPSYIKKAP